MTNYHSPVMLNECIEALNIVPNGIYVDCTFGGGGHSKVIIKKLDESGHLFSFDCDEDAYKNALPNDNFTLVQANFRFLKKFLKLNGVLKVDGILADLGVSSHQFDSAERGFSFRFDNDLDMRMNQASDFSAKNVINTYSAEKLADVLFYYGDVRASRKLARTLIASRPIASTFELKNILQEFSKDEKLTTQVFQAIRIEVNDEMGALKEMLLQAAQILKPNGRLVVMSYHSVEDRIVKNFIKTNTFNGKPKKDLYGRFETSFKPINKKVIIPSDEEIKVNKRARSAKLRIAEKT